ncbi:MAG TPA: ABC transporter ATP-binding protein [Candidatus Limnocylindrales bacterium]|nr:ABC transporter ATP-binding protein [Candidatus Limnocylindrales bacterium]
MAAEASRTEPAPRIPLESQPEIRLAGVTKRFGDVTAVDAVDLEIRAGEFFSLLGPSGCGKTTTLRMIGGFDLPTSGRIELRGRDVTQAPPDKRPVNMVFQSYALFPHLDVAGNIAFGLKRRNVANAEITRRTGEILERVNLAGYQRRRTNELSGGQQQRVALARALVNEPQVLLLDEPLGALDLKLRKRLQVELKRIQMDVGITFVYVTHDQEEALTMSDRIAVMHGGRIEQVGVPEDLYDRPATSFVADFIGTTNLLSGTVSGVEGGAANLRLDTGETCRVAANGHRPGARVQVSLRPEAIALEPPGQVTDALAAAVEQVAYLGAAVQYQVRTPGGLALSVLTGKGGPRFEPGDSIQLSWKPADALTLGEPANEVEDAS